MMWDCILESPRSASFSSAETSVLKRAAAVLSSIFPSLENKGNVSNTPISCTIRELRAHHQHTEKGAVPVCTIPVAGITDLLQNLAFCMTG